MPMLNKSKDVGRNLLEMHNQKGGISHYIKCVKVTEVLDIKQIHSLPFLTFNGFSN